MDKNEIKNLVNLIEEEINNLNGVADHISFSDGDDESAEVIDTIEINIRKHIKALKDIIEKDE